MFTIQEIQEYVGNFRKRKIRLLLALLVSASLLTVSSCYLYDGFNKRFVIYVVLSLGTGVLLVCPRPDRWYTAVPVLGCYLLLAPIKIFQRMELPVHDMSRIGEGVKLANVFIILFIYAVILLFFQRIRFALGIGNIALLIITIVNYYVCLFRGASLSVNDLLATGTAFTVLNNYRLTMDSELWYSILYFCFFIAWGFWCDIPMRGKKYHMAVTAASLCGIAGFYLFWNVSDYLKKFEIQGHYWNLSENQSLNGFLVSFGVSMQEMAMKKPEGYSQEELLRIVNDIQDEYPCKNTLDQQLPNIICIMNEAWSDLRILGNLETSEEFMPFYDALTDNCVKGNTFVEILGGLTANSEFEVLTGDSLAFLAPAAIPYQLQVNHDMYSVARVLREQGYHTMAMHPSTAETWNREKVYRYLGFERFIDVSRFETEYLYVGNFLSDECNFNEIIWQFEHKEQGVPLFLFDVTIQNHASYYGNTDIILNVKKLGDVPAEEAGYLYDVDTYLNLIKLTDNAFQMMVEYFQEVEEPTIICMFGDHQPKLYDDFYNAMFRGSQLSEEEQRALMYITPYVIWANYDVQFPEYGDLSANYLGAALLECAGVKLPPYYRFLLQLQKNYPVISRYTVETLEKEDMVRQYRMLQYNHLMEKNYLKELFVFE